ncbi:MAG: hypothetical protein IT204_25460, partial [Fimbriimonadaceae bacterium]|nr:hypothetical protein [Fimbriimonadaceae bacterium]
MLKNATLGRRIGFGFGSLLAILAVLGLVAVTNMVRVKTKATMLAVEYVPEVSLASELERTTFRTMFEGRRYVLGRHLPSWDSGQEALGQVKANLDKAAQLAANAPHLVKLKEQVPEAQAALSEYEKLWQQTKQEMERWQAAEDNMNKAAPEYMAACYTYLKSQARKQRAETTTVGMLDRAWKLEKVNDVIDVGNALRLAAWKAAALRDATIMQKAMPEFETITKLVAAMKPRTKTSEDMANLNTVLSTAATYKKGCQELIDVLAALDESNKQRLVVGDQVLEIAQQVASAGIDITKKSTTEAAGALATSSAILIIGLLVALGLGIFLAITI